MDEKNVKTPYGSMPYSEGGSGKTLLFLHGAFTTPVAYAELLKKLSESYHVVAPFLPGHGHSFSIPPEWDIGKLSDACGEFIRGLGIHPYAVIGHSFGATIALLMASRGAKARIIAMDAPVHAIRITKTNTLVEAVKTEVRLFMETKPNAKDLRNVYAASASFLSTLVHHPENVQYSYNHGPVFDVEKFLSSIRTPVDFLWGTADIVTPPEEAMSMKKLIPHATIHMLEGRGHLYPTFLPEFTAGEIFTLL